MAALAIVALMATTFSSAASLGGLRTQHLGSASAEVAGLDALALRWTPTWADGSWRAGNLEVSADSDQDFQSGGRIKVTIADPDPACELDLTVTDTSDQIRLTADEFLAACGQLPRLTPATRVAAAVIGPDNNTVHSNVGSLSGSVAGFSGAVVESAGVTHTSTTGGAAAPALATAQVVLDALQPARINGQSASVIVRSAAGDVVGTTTLTVSDDGRTRAHVEPAGASGSTLTFDLRHEQWAVAAGHTVGVSLTLPQSLQLAGNSGPGVVLADGPIEVLAPPVTTPGNGLMPIQVSTGVKYHYPEPWVGVRQNQLTFCHRFSVTNTTSAALADWTVQFDTALPPMWGLNPTEPGVIQFDGTIGTRSYDATTKTWTVGGAHSWSRQLQPGESRSVQFCAERVPVPPVDPGSFDATVRVVAHNDYNVSFQVDVTSDSQFYVPWAMEVDFATLVCAQSLQGRHLQFNQVTATPVPGSSTRYLIQGTQGNTLLVSKTHSRSFEFASYSPGPGWSLPCPAGS